MINAENCTLGYSKKEPVLIDLNFKITHGDFVLIVGKNGSGKTTLLKSFMGLLKPWQGKLAVLNEHMNSKPMKLSYLPQSFPLNPNLNQSVFDFIASAYQGKHWSLPWRSGACQKAVELALKKVNASDLSQQILINLSGGQKQKILLAQCLLDNPELLLLDEPLNHLDRETAQDFMKTLARLNREDSLTVVMVSHEINSVLPYVSHVLYSKPKTFLFANLKEWLEKFHPLEESTACHT